MIYALSVSKLKAEVHNPFAGEENPSGPTNWVSSRFAAARFSTRIVGPYLSRIVTNPMLSDWKILSGVNLVL